MCETGEAKRAKNVEDNQILYTYDEAMEFTGHGSYNYLLLAACCIITNAVALDMFGFSVVVTAGSCDLQLDLTQTGILASAPFVGVLVAYPWGYYADTHGRRRALLLSTTVGFLFAALSSFSTSWQVMMILKVIACCFSSASFTVTMTILGECTGSHHRSKYLFLLNSANLLSEFVSFGLAYFILPIQFKVYIPFLDINFRAWRLFTLVMALPLGVGGLMMAFLYESPKFLANKGDNKKALEVMRDIYKWNGGNRNQYPVHHLLTGDESIVNQTTFWESIVKQTAPIFKPPLLWRTIQLFYLMAVCCSTNNAFVMWFPTMVNVFFNSFYYDLATTEKTFCQRIFGDDEVTVTNVTEEIEYICNDTIAPNTIYSGILYGMFFFLVTMLVSMIASWRRVVLVSSLLVAGVSGTLVNLYNPTASLIFYVLFQATIVGISSVIAYCVDLYPTSNRGMMTSLCMMVARLCSFGGINLIGAVITNNCYLTFYSWSAVVLSAIPLALMLPGDKKINT